jgi:hypothetical protein
LWLCGSTRTAYTRIVHISHGDINYCIGPQSLGLRTASPETLMAEQDRVSVSHISAT